MNDCDDISLGGDQTDTEPIKTSTAATNRKGKGKSKGTKEQGTTQKGKKTSRATESTRLKKGTQTSAEVASTIAGPAQALATAGTTCTTSQTDASASSSRLPPSTFTPPPAPTTIDQLPSSIAALDSLLPSFRVTQVVDTVEEHMEDALAALALAPQPDMVRYLQLSLDILKAQRSAITQDDSDEALIQLMVRKKALQWYLSQYTLLRPVAQSARRAADIPTLTVSPEVPVQDAQFYGGMEMDVDDLSAPFRELVVS